MRIETMTSAASEGVVNTQAQHTPGPWVLGEYNDALGYDCMTGGVRCGPAYLDGGDYGQRPCTEIEDDILNRMMADARLIAAAPDTKDACIPFARAADQIDDDIPDDEVVVRSEHGFVLTAGQFRAARASLSKAEGRS